MDQVQVRQVSAYPSMEMQRKPPTRRAGGAADPLAKHALVRRQLTQRRWPARASQCATAHLAGGLALLLQALDAQLLCLIQNA